MLDIVLVQKWHHNCWCAPQLGVNSACCEPRDFCNLACVAWLRGRHECTRGQNWTAISKIYYCRSLDDYRGRMLHQFRKENTFFFFYQNLKENSVIILFPVSTSSIPVPAGFFLLSGNTYSLCHRSGAPQAPAETVTFTCTCSIQHGENKWGFTVILNWCD